MVAVGVFLATLLWFGWDGGVRRREDRQTASTTPSARRRTCPTRAPRDRRAHARPQQARRHEAVPHGSRPRCLRPHARARPRPGRCDRWRARGWPRARRRRDGRAHHRHCALHRGHAALHRRIGRRGAAHIRRRGATGGWGGSAIVRRLRATRFRPCGRLRRRPRRRRNPASTAARRRGDELPRRDRVRADVRRVAPARDALGGRRARRHHRRRRPRDRLRQQREHRVPATRPLAPEAVACREGRQRRRECTDGRAARADTVALRRRRDDRRADRRAARDPVRAAARTRDEGLEGRRPQGRPLVCARDDRDPHSGADSREAGRRGGGAEPLAEARHARRHLRRHAGPGEPALGLARQGHLGKRRLDRPCADAASPHRRHHGLGQVRTASTRSSRRSSCARRRTRCA